MNSWWKFLLLNRLLQIFMKKIFQRHSRNIFNALGLWEGIQSLGRGNRNTFGSKLLTYKN